MAKFKVLIPATIAGTDRSAGDILDLDTDSVDYSPLLENGTLVSVDPGPVSAGQVRSDSDNAQIMAETKSYTVLGEVDVDIHGVATAPGTVVELDPEYAGPLVGEGKLEEYVPQAGNTAAGDNTGQA